MREGMSSDSPRDHFSSSTLEMRICSLLVSGSASIPINARRLDAVVWTLSRKRSPSDLTASGGASKERRALTILPAELPGV